MGHNTGMFPRLAKCAGPTLLALLPLACSTTPKEPDPVWQDDVVFAPSESLLWDATIQNLFNLGYPVGSEANPSTMEIVTGWKTKLAPYRGEGYRLKAEVRFTPSEAEGTGGQAGLYGWDIQVRVARQENMAIVKPLDPSMAEWEWRPDDVVEAAILLRHILSEFPARDVTLPPEPAPDMGLPGSL